LSTVEPDRVAGARSGVQIGARNRALVSGAPSGVQLGARSRALVSATSAGGQRP
jgi:hypothetical protein